MICKYFAIFFIKISKKVSVRNIPAQCGVTAQAFEPLLQPYLYFSLQKSNFATPSHKGAQKPMMHRLQSNTL
jgi:hypothetical protein